MDKTIISAKPHKNGYKITRFKWDSKSQRYTDIKTLTFLADKEQAQFYIKGVESIAKEEGKKTQLEISNKWVFLTIEERE